MDVLQVTLTTRGIGLKHRPIRLAPSAALLGAIALTAAVLDARVFVLLVAAPLLEETVFRAGLQEGLLRRWTQPNRSHAGAGAAIVITALAFAAVHFSIKPGPLSALTVLPALAIGAVYTRSRQVLPCAAMHALFNGCWLLSAAA